MINTTLQNRHSTKYKKKTNAKKGMINHNKDCSLKLKRDVVVKYYSCNCKECKLFLRERDFFYRDCMICQREMVEV